MHSACDRPQRRAPKPRPLAASMPTLPLPIALSLVSSCLIVPAAPSRLSRRDPNTSMRVACTEGRRGSQVGRGAVRGRIFRGAGAHQPVRDGVGRKLRPPRLDAADRAVDAELPRPRDLRALPRAHVSCVHERVSGVSVMTFCARHRSLPACSPSTCVRCRAAEAVSRGYQTETGTHRSSMESHAGS